MNIFFFHFSCSFVSHLKVVVFTHCGVGLGATSLQTTIANLIAQNATKAASASASNSSNLLNQPFLLNETSNDSWIPFSNLSKLSFICLGSTAESYFLNAIEIYQQFLDVSGQKGQLFIAHTEADPNKIIKNSYNGDASIYPTTSQWKNEIINRLIEEMCEINYKPFEATLSCGEYHNLESPITIWPTPMV